MSNDYRNCEGCGLPVAISVRSTEAPTEAGAETPDPTAGEALSRIAAEVKGKRLLIAAEMQEGARLNDSTVKQLCSTDDVFAEKKYKDPFSFKPCHTLVVWMIVGT